MAESRYKMISDHHKNVIQLKEIIKKFKDVLLHDVEETKELHCFAHIRGCVRLGHLHTLRWIIIPREGLPVDLTFVQEFNRVEHNKRRLRYFHIYKFYE